MLKNQFADTRRGRPALTVPIVAVVVLAAGSCAPSPRDVPCSNDAECESASKNFSYCLESRCVECISSIACGDGNRCDNGICTRRCKDGRDCPDGQQCFGGTCASP
jgi:hypothetical protein